jgi:hypothetical protein
MLGPPGLSQAFQHSILEMMGLLELSFEKARKLLRDCFYIFSWLLMVPRGFFYPSRVYLEPS